MKKLIILFVLLFAARVEATTWYADATKSDSNNCTQAQTPATAKATINAALACAGSAGGTGGAGNTVQVVAGTYSDQISDKIPGGTAGNVFTLKCASDLACILSPGSGNFAIGINSPSLNYVLIRGFKVTSGEGMFLSGAAVNTHTNIQFDHMEVDGTSMNTDAMGIQGSGSGDITVSNSSIHNLNGGGGLSHGIYASTDTTNWIIRNNVIYSNGAYGIHLFGDDPTWPSGFNVYDNRTYLNGTTGVNGTGIIAYGPNHKIYNNLVYQNLNQGILIRSGASGVVLYENTIYDNHDEGILDQGNAVTCKNNLAISDGSTEISGCAVTSNNITTGTPASHFVNAAGGDFNLVSGSTAIGAGANLGSPYDVDFAGTARPPIGAWDAGAYQFAAPPSTPVNVKIAAPIKIGSGVTLEVGAQ